MSQERSAAGTVCNVTRGVPDRSQRRTRRAGSRSINQRVCPKLRLGRSLNNNLFSPGPAGRRLHSVVASVPQQPSNLCPTVLICNHRAGWFYGPELISRGRRHGGGISGGVKPVIDAPIFACKFRRNFAEACSRGAAEGEEREK